MNRRNFFTRVLGSLAATTVPIELPAFEFSGYRSRALVENSLVRQMSEDITKEIDAAMIARLVAEAGKLIPNLGAKYLITPP